MQLAIDTSTDTASLALTEDNRIIAELTWKCGRNHTIQLLPNLEFLLKQNSLTLESVNCVIVATGPGSYNGLRVGLSTARGLAFSLGVPIVGIGTLEAEAWQHAEKGLPICPVLNAGREEVASAAWQMIDGLWTQLTDIRLSGIEDLCSGIEEKTLFCGEYVYTVAEELRDRLQDKAVIVHPGSVLRRGGFLAELGWKRIQVNDFDDVAALQPHYFRGPSITKPNPGKK